MSRLLLVSSSTTHGTGYLDHCQEEIIDHFGSAGVTSILFIPYALADWDSYANKSGTRLRQMGLQQLSLHTTPKQAEAIAQAQGIFIGGGNTFRLLKELYDRDLIEPIRQRVQAGAPYLGTSAGTNVACPTIMTTNDMPIVYPPSLNALNLVPFQINAHYLDADPESTHMGETRDTRLDEFHEENRTPVVALREGAMLSVVDSTTLLLGQPGGKLFRPGRHPVECSPRTRINRLLAS